MIHRVSTFKSGNFAFSRKYDKTKLQPFLLETQILYETVADLPILPALATRLQQDLIRRSIFGTAALEGNPLTEEEVGRILSESAQAESKGKAEREIRNLGEAYQLVRTMNFSYPSVEISEETVKKLHELITNGTEHQYNSPGQYRNCKVKVGDSNHGGVYTPPKG